MFKLLRYSPHAVSTIRSHPKKTIFASLVLLTTGYSAFAFPELRKHPILFSQCIIRFTRFAILSARIWILFNNPFSKKTDNELYAIAGQMTNKTLRTNSGISIKVGQILAMMDVLLEPAFTEELLSLFQAAPESKVEDIKASIEEELGRPFDDIFIEFNPKPIACGSIAQVYEGRLRESGKRVAVKVRHSFLRETFEFDLAVMGFFIKLGNKVCKNFNYRWLYDDSCKSLRMETDFTIEAANIARITKLMKDNPYLIFPTVFREYSSKGVLTMEFVEGYSITQVERLKQDGVRPDFIARTMAKSFSKMIFELGFVHADPHPGNLFIQIRPNGEQKLVLLDNGLYAELSEVTRTNYARMWVGIINRDEELLKEATINLGVGFAHRLFVSMVTNQSFESVIDANEGDVYKRLKGSSPAEEKRRQSMMFAKRWRKEILECMERVNRDMLLLFKIHNYIEAIDTKLGQPINNYWYTAKFAFESNMKRASSWKNRFILRIQMIYVFMWLLVYEWGLIIKLGLGSPDL